MWIMLLMILVVDKLPYILVLIGLSAKELDILDEYEAEEYDKQVVDVSLLVPVHARLLNVQVPSPINHGSQNNSSYVAMDGVANGALSQAESLVHSSKKLEDELILLGKNIKHHEENTKWLKTCMSSLDDQITDMQVTLGKNHSSITPMTEDEDNSHTLSQQAIVKHIMQNEKSAAALVCQLKSGTHADYTYTNDVLGVVATLGKVTDDKLSRLLSEYLGLDTMLALVCMTYNGVEALETYDEEGVVSKSSGLHGLGASIGKTIDGRFNVIFLENQRFYFLSSKPNFFAGKIILDLHSDLFASFFEYGFRP